MTKDHLHVQIPPEVVDKLQLEPGEEFALTISEKQITLSPLKKKVNTQTISLRWFLIPALVSTAIFIGYFLWAQTKLIPLTGNISIASLTIVVGLLSGIITFLTFFIRQKCSKVASAASIYWRNVPAVVLAVAVTLGICLLIAFWGLGIVFKGSSFDLLTAALIYFMFAAILNYVMILLALSLSSSLLINLLILVIIGGIISAMVTNSQLEWWQVNFSFLGTTDAKNAWQFNLTLMLTALLMIVLVDYLFVHLNKLYPKNYRLLTLRVLLVLTAIDLGAVGFFPNTPQLHNIHDRAANYLVYLILILILAIRFLLPQVSREFLVASYGMGAILFVCNILFQTVGYLSLTAFELIAFALAFAWVLLLLQNLQRLIVEDREIYYLTLTNLAEIPTTTKTTVDE